MRLLVQRVSSAQVSVAGERIGSIAAGLLVLAGFAADDTLEKITFLADKCAHLRIFEDDAGKMNVGPADAGAEILIISQFTLYADTRSRRPGFTAAARPETAIPLYERVIEACRARGFHVETGEFGAEMAVASVNDGPVTILLDTKEL